VARVGARLWPVTLRPDSYADPSSAGTDATAGSTARPLTEPLRELTVLALLAGNGIFLIVGFSRLFFVLDGWATDFGLRCAAVFGTFVGPLSLALPILAMLLATHVRPLLRHSRPILITVGVQLAVSALFGAITFLGAFAYDVATSVRATIEDTLLRVVWLAFLVLACIAVTRVWLGLFPPSRPQPAGYYAQPSYGRPYPGQPMYAPPSPPVSTSWPVVPPPPRPQPLVVEPDATIRVAPAEVGEDVTQKLELPRQEIDS
jgi:hypothetical protein